MSAVVVCRALSGNLGELFECSEKNDLVRVRTPFWYPDGGIVDVFVREVSGGFEVSDLGEALGWLRLQSLSPRRSPRQQRLIQDVGQTLGVELFQGQILARCQRAEQLSSTVHRVGQAIVRVSDLWFTTRTRSIESISDEVADFLREKEISFERGVKLAGRSGRDWQVDFQTRTATRSTLVFLLATGSRAAAHRVSEHVVAGWHDLQPFKVGPSGLYFVSLFDDTSDVWVEEDFRLVESLSEVSRWSRPDEFLDMLHAA